MPGARGARMVRTAAAPTAPQMTVMCPACGAAPGYACRSLAAPPAADQNLKDKPSHYARRHAYFLAEQVPNPDILQGRPDLAPDAP